MAIGKRNKMGKVPEGEGVNLIIPRASEYKYLGVMVNDKWDWSTHVKYVTSRVSKKNNAMKSVIFRN